MADRALAKDLLGVGEDAVAGGGVNRPAYGVADLVDAVGVRRGGGAVGGVSGGEREEEREEAEVGAAHGDGGGAVSVGWVRSLQQFGELALHGVEPELVACGGEVQVVGHDVFGDGAVGLEKGLADIEEEDLLAVVEAGEGGVDLGELRGGVAPEVVGADEEDEGFGEMPSRLPWRMRQRTFSVRSPPMPKLAGFRVA